MAAPPKRQLGLLDALLAAGLRRSDPALGAWIEERVREAVVETEGCSATAELECRRCGRVERRRVRCGPSCTACARRGLARARVTERTLSTLPPVPTRHVVVSLSPVLTEALLAGRLEVEVLQRSFERITFDAVADALCRRGLRIPRRKLGFGAVTVVHPFDASLNVSPHLHALVLDGAFVREGGPDGDRPRFETTPEAFSTRGLEAIAAELHAELSRRTRVESPTAEPVRALRRSSARASRLASKSSRPPPPLGDAAARCGQVQGLRVHGGETIHPDDRSSRRRVLEYMGRPALDPASVSKGPRGTLQISRPAQAGRPAETLEMSPGRLAERLASMGSLARPGVLRQHGLMARRSAQRWGFEAQQLPLLRPEDPARTRIAEPTGMEARRKRDATRPETESLLSRTAPHGPRTEACRRCGGELRVRVLDEAS